MAAPAPISKWKPAMFLAAGLACTPIAPLFYGYVRASRAREARRHARFVTVQRVAVDRGELVLHGAHGVVARVTPATVRHARWIVWGDGIDGSAYDVGLSLDAGLRVAATGWPPDALAPLVAALHAVRALPLEPERRRRPAASDGYLAMYAMLEIAFDALVLGCLARWLRARS